jgi:hypothetical protein
MNLKVLIRFAVFVKQPWRGLSVMGTFDCTVVNNYPFKLFLRQSYSSYSYFFKVVKK